MLTGYPPFRVSKNNQQSNQHSKSYKPDILAESFCMTFEMLSHKGPPEHFVIVHLSRHNLPLYLLPCNTSDQVRNFLSRCFIVDWKQRPAAAQLLSDPFIKGNLNVLSVYLDNHNFANFT